MGNLKEVIHSLTQWSKLNVFTANCHSAKFKHSTDFMKCTLPEPVVPAPEVIKEKLEEVKETRSDSRGSKRKPRSRQRSRKGSKESICAFCL